ETEDGGELEPERMCARSSLLVAGSRRVSQAVEGLSEEALFWILEAGLAQVLAHLGFADMSWFGHSLKHHYGLNLVPSLGAEGQPKNGRRSDLFPDGNHALKFLV